MNSKVKTLLPAGTKIPNHVVIIPDGDRRWARARGMSPSDGHRAGMENMVKLARTARSWGIHTVSAWGLSTENWMERPKEEVDFLMKGIVQYLGNFIDEMDKDGVRVVHLGRKDRMPQFLLKKIAEVEERTRNNTRHVFNIALDYNGWDEVTRAMQKISAEGIPAGKIDRKTLDQHMDTFDQPYPYVDLFIRTSGEQRTSGFMMWQADYAEFYWEEEYFPAFTPDKLKTAILDYSRRRRRFGGNDKEEHLKFDPKIAARLDLEMQRHVDTNTIINYLREQYGMSKELAKESAHHLAKAFVYRERKEWQEAKGALKELYGLVRKNINLAFEPEIVANVEVKMWQDPTEDNMRELLAEKYRFSTFQASKSAHLAILGQQEATRGNWDKAKGFFEKYYAALKERVA